MTDKSKALLNAIETLSKWAHDSVTGIATRCDILGEEARRSKTEKERMDKLMEISELAGYAKAMLALQEKISELLTKMIAEIK